MAGAAANEEWILVSRPDASGVRTSNFKLRGCAMPERKEGYALVAVQLLSLDPTMRNFMAGDDVAMSKQQNASYYKVAASWGPGKPPAGAQIGVVVAGDGDKGPRAGSLVRYRGPWRRYAAVRVKDLEVLDPSIKAEQHMAVLGGTGLAAYLPCVHIGAPKKGETAFVSGGAGATGSCAAQVLRLLGCNVVASAGSDAKCAMLEGLGVRAFNYKKADTLAELRRLCPKGVDIYFDNVGGPTLEAALEAMNDFGRVIACGAISQYDLPPEKRYGVRNLFHITAKRLRFQGYVTDPLSFTAPQFADARETLSRWLRDGQLRSESTVVDGFDKMPEALIGLFSGENTGKMMVRVAAPTGGKL